MEPDNSPKSFIKSVWAWIVFFFLTIFGFLAWLGPSSVVVVPHRVFIHWNYPVISISTISNRKSDIEFIRGKIQHEHIDGKYLVVHGPKGIGKTCAIETAVQNMRGIIFTKSIWPETSAKDIVQSALSSVAMTDDHVEENALKILSWYKFLTGDTLTIVLNVKTRNKSI